MRAAVFATVLLLSSAAAEAQQPPSPGHAGMTMPSANSEAGRSMMEGMERMNRAMAAAPMTGDPDHDFLAMMIPHHQGAIEMAKTELKYGKDPRAKRLARAIIAAQEREIAQMRRWLASPRP